MELSEDFYTRIEHRLHQRIGEELRLARRIIDVGCGGCALAGFLAETYGQEVIGVDITPGAFPAPSDTSKTRPAHLRCIKANAEHLDFLADQTVDAAVMQWALHEMAHPVAVITELRRVLRPAGELLIVDFPRDSLAQRLWNENYYTPQQVSEMLEQAGYEHVSAKLIEQRQVIWASAFQPRL